MSHTNATPYDGTMIFKPAAPLKSVMEAAAARCANKKNPVAARYAKPEVYQSFYADALKRLHQPDILSLTDIAARLGMTANKYKALAERGQAILICIEGQTFAPAWSVTEDGKIDDLKVDIAREFSKQGRSYFEFMDFFKFMTEDNTNIAHTLPRQNLSAAFQAAGVQDFKCALIVEATMNQLADSRENPALLQMLFQTLDNAVTDGGFGDPFGGLSRPFRNKYNIPGLSIDEERSVPAPKP